MHGALRGNRSEPRVAVAAARRTFARPWKSARAAKRSVFSTLPRRRASFVDATAIILRIAVSTRPPLCEPTRQAEAGKSKRGRATSGGPQWGEREVGQVDSNGRYTLDAHHRRVDEEAAGRVEEDSRRRRGGEGGAVLALDRHAPACATRCERETV